MATIVGSLVGSCAKKLQEIITDEAILILGVKEELGELHEKMEQVRCFLSDAERKGTEDLAVNHWLSRLKDAMYDADDIIDLASLEGSKLLSGHSSSSSKSTACSGLSLLSCFSNIRTRHEIADKIRSLNSKIEKISKDKVFATLETAQPTGNGSVTKLRERSHLVEPNLVGMEIKHSCRKLVGLVLAHKEEKSYKIAILGTGGIGKTTLAQKVYNDQKIKESFSKYAWICVSQEYSPVSLLSELLRKMQVQYVQGESVGELQSRLESAIKDKSFFLILDDVWQSNVWTDLLRTPLHAAASGIILVTSRLDFVAREIRVGITHRVDLMSPDVSWELLWKSMNINEEKEVQNLRDIGIEIVKKCGCLPLAVKVVARVLASKDLTENEWKKIIRTNAWSMTELPEEIRGAFYLSYDDLPQHLKQCFLYCIIYPEDWNIRRDELIRLWVAEGFIEEKAGELLEDTAEEYYYELISRNLLQPEDISVDRSRCKMHDLLRQLACHISREECFIGDPERIEEKALYKLRRVLVVTEKDMVVIPSKVKEKLKVRTFRTDQRPLGVENTFFKTFTCLRVLDLSDSTVHSIPDYVGDLIHLRLLDLDGTNISCLPESICSLKNLQMLHLQRCASLHSLPLAITKLCNLRRLGLGRTPINKVPKGIGRLKFLNDLEGFPIGSGTSNSEMQDGWSLVELAPLSQLRKLDLFKLERASPCSSIDSLLTNKKHLKALILQCTEQTYEAYSEGDVSNIEKVFEQLIPPHNLENLDIVRFFGQRHPTWLGSAHLSSLKFMNLMCCNSWVHLPPIGQLPNLKFLRIDGAPAVTKIGLEFVGCGVSNTRSTEADAFPNLESLVIVDMPNWEEWSFVEEGEGEEAPAAAIASEEGGEDGAAVKQQGETSSPWSQRLLPCLKELHLLRCPKLRGLPRQLGQVTRLKNLNIREACSLKAVEDLPFLSGYISVGGCEALEKVSNLPQVRELFVAYCPNLRCAEKLGGLEQLFLGKDMQKITPLWVPELQQLRRELHGEELDVLTWL